MMDTMINNILLTKFFYALYIILLCF